jgi:hypothetical protein
MILILRVWCGGLPDRRSHPDPSGGQTDPRCRRAGPASRSRAGRRARRLCTGHGGLPREAPAERAPNRSHRGGSRSPEQADVRPSAPQIRGASARVSGGGSVPVLYIESPRSLSMVSSLGSGAVLARRFRYRPSILRVRRLWDGGVSRQGKGEGRLSNADGSLIRVRCRTHSEDHWAWCLCSDSAPPGEDGCSDGRRPANR